MAATARHLGPAAIAASALAFAVPASDARPLERCTLQQVLKFDSAPLGASWPESTRYGAWYSVHNGFGFTHVEQAGTVRRLWLAPKAAADASQTFSALIRSVQSFGDLDMTVRVQTYAQLRRPKANPWEVAWVLWHYTDSDHFYYFSLKPNGWELGKEDPAYRGKQRFLASSTGRAYPVRRWYRVRVRQLGNEIAVWVDDRLAVRFTDRQRPYGAGHVALYVEDAAAVFGPVALRTCRAV